MQLGPIISSLRRHRSAATLLVLEIALTCAIVSNAVFLIGERLSNMNRTSGIAESELALVHVAGIKDRDNAKDLTAQDFAALRALPGVKSVATSNQVPFGDSSWNSDVRLDPDDALGGVNSATYLGTEDLVETLGLRLVAGRDFAADEYIYLSDLQVPEPTVEIDTVIITEALAERMYPGKNALGEVLYVWGDEPKRIIGIVDHLVRPGKVKKSRSELSVVLPMRLNFGEGAYFLRVESEQRQETLKLVVAAIEKNDPNRVILAQTTYEEIRDKAFAGDRAMAWLLVAVCLALLLITALGIIGLTSFWVQQRRRQIGVRRALGATRAQILAYFQTENLLLTTFGIVVGMIMAFGINSKLMEHYEVARLPWVYLPIGAGLLYMLCQVAVLGPAMRATRVPPAVATRGA